MANEHSPAFGSRSWCWPSGRTGSRPGAGTAEPDNDAGGACHHRHCEQPYLVPGRPGKRRKTSDRPRRHNLRSVFQQRLYRCTCRCRHQARRPGNQWPVQCRHRRRSCRLQWSGPMAEGAGGNHQAGMQANPACPLRPEPATGSRYQWRRFGNHRQQRPLVQNTATSGRSYAIRAEDSSTGGRGLIGEAKATSGDATGVRGESASTTGYGVYGWAKADSGQNYGVYGKSDSPNGIGGYFEGGTGIYAASNNHGIGIYAYTESTDYAHPTLYLRQGNPTYDFVQGYAGYARGGLAPQMEGGRAGER